MTRSQRLDETYRGRRVLVTGNTGFKGSWLVAWLCRMGAEVTGFADGIPTTPNHHERLGLPIRQITGDVADPAAIASAVREIRPEVVFHLAAQSLVRQSYADPIGTYQTNVMGTLAVFEACRKAGGVRAIVSATTDKVYRNNEWDWGYRETDILGGSDPYSASKSCVEVMTESYRLSFLEDSETLVASVRAGNVIGGGDWAADRLLPDIFRAAFDSRPVTIRNPASTRPWQHVLDPLAGYLIVGAGLLKGERPMAEAWNFGPVHNRGLSVGEIVRQIGAKIDGLEVVLAPSGVKESGLLELDSTKAVRRLGWQPVWEGQMLDRCIEWYRAFYEDGALATERQLREYLAALDEAG